MKNSSRTPSSPGLSIALIGALDLVQVSSKQTLWAKSHTNRRANFKYLRQSFGERASERQNEAEGKSCPLIGQVQARARRHIEAAAHSERARATKSILFYGNFCASLNFPLLYLASICLRALSFALHLRLSF